MSSQAQVMQEAETEKSRVRSRRLSLNKLSRASTSTMDNFRRFTSCLAFGQERCEALRHLLSLKRCFKSLSSFLD